MASSETIPGSDRLRTCDCVNRGSPWIAGERQSRAASNRRRSPAQRSARGADSARASSAALPIRQSRGRAECRVADRVPAHRRTAGPQRRQLGRPPPCDQGPNPFGAVNLVAADADQVDPWMARAEISLPNP